MLKQLHGYSRTGSEIVHISYTTPVLRHSFNYYIELDDQRRIVNAGSYSFFTPVNYQFNLAGTFAGQAVESLLYHLQTYGCTWNVTEFQPWGQVKIASRIQEQLGYTVPLYYYLNTTAIERWLSNKLRDCTKTLKCHKNEIQALKDRCRVLECMIMEKEITYRNKTAAGRLREYVRRNMGFVKAITLQDQQRINKLLTVR